MEGLPENTDFKALVGRRITMMRITKHLLHYILNDEKPEKPDVWIAIESESVIFTDSEGKRVEIKDFRTNGGPLCLLLGLTIEGASRRDDGGLLLEMSDGFRLEVPIDTPMYESVVLHIGDEAIIG